MRVRECGTERVCAWVSEDSQAAEANERVRVSARVCVRERERVCECLRECARTSNSVIRRCDGREERPYS